MLREKRNKEKLKLYYDKYIQQNEVDPNVHPWIAASWQESHSLNIANDDPVQLPKLSKDKLANLQQKHTNALNFLTGLYQTVHEFFHTNNLNLLLLDENCYALKSYAMPFFQKTPGEVEGSRLAIQDIGTSSISIAYEHQTSFLMFGPEMWRKDAHNSDACSVPIMINDELRYIITLISVQENGVDPDMLVTILLSMKYAMETHLKTLERLEATHTILDAVPLAVYHILPGGTVAYTNTLGQNRLSGILPEHSNEKPNLNNVVLNYRHTPIKKGFYGIPSYNKEVTWITPRKTYEDITTVVPIFRDEEVSSVVAVSLPIEDLRTLVAHAAGYISRYSLSSMVGESSSFLSMKEKATRAAKHDHHLLLQGESGTGKQRLAHGIHQASPRAAGPLISVKCGDMPLELLDAELFGIIDSQAEARPGKLELANGGTLFLDEVEKLPMHLANRLAEALVSGRLTRANDTILRSFDVRIIAACDSDLKRLAERGVFSDKFFSLIAKSMIRVPSLRSRSVDIPIITNHIITELAEQHHLPIKSLAPDGMQVLTDYDWPGNIKQLQGVVEQAFFQTAGDIIFAESILIPGRTNLDKAWKEDKEVFMTAWRAAGGNISRLANMLDVSRVTLYRYLKKYGLERH
ncbi:DNA-binding NtrC family response regulator [Sporomusaceae bacterium BoRhaA]|uniref:sigma 54-interacting transcriptional regulator n=1 Tax=Pelorhabdus rhamnosifermentans TaxID=2772457 RepID=UPI001C0648CA|nr:sigma 54-interacting transcriptional regulator [Pelorhabdus rhamnosifermentans]MBU2700564.1 DNA-binding NtrC family response regulator [Pelorhabdus rhamnosifermentans]